MRLLSSIRLVIAVHCLAPRSRRQVHVAAGFFHNASTAAVLARSGLRHSLRACIQGTEYRAFVGSFTGRRSPADVSDAGRVHIGQVKLIAVSPLSVGGVLRLGQLAAAHCSGSKYLGMRRPNERR